MDLVFKAARRDRFMKEIVTQDSGAVPRDKLDPVHGQAPVHAPATVSLFRAIFFYS